MILAESKGFLPVHQTPPRTLFTLPCALHVFRPLSASLSTLPSGYFLFPLESRPLGDAEDFPRISTWVAGLTPVLSEISCSLCQILE